MRKEIVLISLLFLVLTLVFFYPVFLGKIPFPGDLLVGQYTPYNSNSYYGIAPGGVPNKGQDFDVIRMLFPWKEYAVKSMAKGEIPFWNPYNLSGTPFLANFQSGFFYPFNVLFLILPMFTAWGSYIIIQPFLAMIFTYFLLREFALSRKSAVFGSIVFAFSSSMTVWMEYGNLLHAAIWLPLILLLLEKSLKNPRVSMYLAMVLLLTLSIFAGHIQMSIYVFTCSFLFLIFRVFSLRSKQPLQKISLYLPVFFLPVFLAAVQIVPTLELFFQSARNAYSASAIANLLIPPVHFITTFVPDFFGNPATQNYWLSGTYIERVSYIGIVPLIFVFLAFFRKQTSLFWFFTIFAASIYFLAFRNPVSIFFYSLPIPFLNTTVPTRSMFLFCFCASLCSAFGFESWLKNPTKFFRPLLIPVLIYSCLWLSVIILPHIYPGLSTNLAVARRNLFLPTGILISIIFLLLINKFTSFRKTIIVVIFLLTIFDLFYFFQKITPFSPPAYFFPDTQVLQKLKSLQGIDRSWGYGDGYMAANFQTHEDVFSTEGYEPLFIKNYGEFVYASNNGKLASAVPRSDVNIAPGSGTDSLRLNFFRQRVLNISGVKYVLHKMSYGADTRKADTLTFPEETYRLVWQETPWQVYENLKAVPRIFLTADFIVDPDKNETISDLLDPQFSEAKTLILSEKPGIRSSTSLQSSVKLLSYLSNKIELQTSADKAALLFISDNYYPGWKVLIDGKIGKIYRADYTFRAVPLPKGKHDVVFIYSPKSFLFGLAISLLTAFTLLVIIVILKILRKEFRKTR